ncbi:MAG: hypothetical protein M1546_11820 [Chloroflexi bacterium]|nr:hypothetical protein [Chloroflexota bacterium]
MATKTSAQRQAIKTPEAAFVHVLQEEFQFSARLSGEVLQAAQEMLLGHTPLRSAAPGSGARDRRELQSTRRRC